MIFLLQGLVLCSRLRFFLAVGGGRFLPVGRHSPKVPVLSVCGYKLLLFAALLLLSLAVWFLLQ